MDMECYFDKINKAIDNMSDDEFIDLLNKLGLEKCSYLEDLVNCNNCKWINLTEEQQVDKTIDHICLKHKVRVIHRSSNPKIHHNFIYPCDKCDGNDFEQN